jgi:ABC-type thiamine transport system substrate-binding protein
MIVEHLFSPVVAVAGTVCIIGLVIFVISFMVRDRIQTRIVEKQIASPAPESVEKPLQHEEKSVEAEEKPVETESEESDKKEE